MNTSTVTTLYQIKYLECKNQKAPAKDGPGQFGLSMKDIMTSEISQKLQFPCTCNITFIEFPMSRF